MPVADYHFLHLPSVYGFYDRSLYGVYNAVIMFNPVTHRTMRVMDLFFPIPYRALSHAFENVRATFWEKIVSAHYIMRRI